MKYAIIENEEFAQLHLNNMIRSIRGDWECVFTAQTVEDSISELEGAPSLDLIFMDIELDDGSSFEIFNNMEIKIPIIFTTAYSEFAIQAFKVNSVDYLLKPFDELDLTKAIEKFEENYNKENVRDYGKLSEAFSITKRPKRLLISDSSSYSFLNVDDIAWFEAEDKYVSVTTIAGKSILTDLKSLSNISDLLDPDDFFQISRSLIVSIKAIGKVERHFKGRLSVSLHAGSILRKETISSARRNQFLVWLGHL